MDLETRKRLAAALKEASTPDVALFAFACAMVAVRATPSQVWTLGD